MEVTCTLRLCIDPYNPNLGYWLESSGTYDIDSIRYVATGNDTFSNNPDGEGNFHLVLKVESNSGNGPYQHPVLHLVELGVLNDPDNVAEIFVDLKAGNTRVGGGKVKLSSAEQTSRPIPFKNR